MTYTVDFWHLLQKLSAAAAAMTANDAERDELAGRWRLDLLNRDRAATRILYELLSHPVQAALARTEHRRPRGDHLSHQPRRPHPPRQQSPPRSAHRQRAGRGQREVHLLRPDEALGRALESAHRRSRAPAPRPPAQRAPRPGRQHGSPETSSRPKGGMISMAATPICPAGHGMGGKIGSQEPSPSAEKPSQQNSDGIQIERQPPLAAGLPSMGHIPPCTVSLAHLQGGTHRGHVARIRGQRSSPAGALRRCSSRRRRDEASGQLCSRW